MLPARYRLTSPSEIARTIRHGQRARRGAVVVHVQVGDGAGQTPRAAFAVSKAVGDSVVRHRVVRRLRALMPPLLERLPGGTEVVVRAMPEAATASSADLQADLERSLSRIIPLGSVPSGPTDDAVIETAGDLPGSTQGSTPRSAIGQILWWLGWPIRSLLIGLIWVYRHTISPMLPPTCRYHPSCSAYGFESLQVHGAAKGALLTGWRVLRCNPFSRGGLDPVPAKGAWRPDIHPDGTPRVTRTPVA